MKAPSFKTIHTAVRPARVVVLVDRSDQDWQDTCLHVIEFFSQLWGGAYNLIVPTDGRSIGECFWTILEAFDPDYLYTYGKSGEDLRLGRPEQYQKLLHAHLSSWVSQFGSENIEGVKQQIDDQLRGTWASEFGITAELQNEIKVRLAPFWFEQWIVQAGAIGARSGVRFPLTSLAKILPNTQHSDRFAAIKTPPSLLPEVWYAAFTGRLGENSIKEFEAVGLSEDLFDFAEDDISQLIEFVVTGEIRKPWTLRENKRVFAELDGITPYQLSMLQLGLYRPTKYPYWLEPMLLVAGNTLDDFCFYYCLSRLRDRVLWVLPSITEKALEKTGEESRVETSFISHVRNTQYSQQRPIGGFACASCSLSDAEIEAVIGRLQTSRLGNFGPQIRRGADVGNLVRMPIVAAERDNLQRDIPIQLLEDTSISPFPTPKPKNFATIHPHEHRYITQLSVVRESPPKHFDLGRWVVGDPRLTTNEVRVGRDGPAYFCPNVAYFGGDIDTVLVKPYVHLPPLEKILVTLARALGYECRPSDKGIYASEALTKWGGLPEIASFLRNGAKRSLLDRYLDSSRSKSGDGVFLKDDRRRYLDLSALKNHVGNQAADLVDELISKQIFYRGYIFGCGYCRNAAWFSISEISEKFKCRRCGREQVYARANWKMPDEPAWFYKLDELVYQGYRQGMAVTLLALDHLRSETSDNFSFTTDREFWKPAESKPDAEVDFSCVMDGVLTIGEAKREGCLGNSTSEENAEIAKYRRVAGRLAARRIVFATLADNWSVATVQRAMTGFNDMRHVQVRFLTAQQLLS